MKITNQRKTNLRKRFVLFTLIAAMLITLVPAANVSAASAAYLTEDPNADLYPFPLDMNFLSKYLYGSAENTKGTVATYYAKEVPNEWLPREMPASLRTSYWGKAVVHTTKAKVYFYPGTPSVNYHKKRMDEINKTAYSYLGDIPTEMQISPFIARKQANSRFLHMMRPGLQSGVMVQSMSAEDLKAPVVDLERSSTPAGSRVYILFRARTFISRMQETSSWIFRP